MDSSIKKSLTRILVLVFLLHIIAIDTIKVFYKDMEGPAPVFTWKMNMGPYYIHLRYVASCPNLDNDQVKDVDWNFDITDGNNSKFLVNGWAYFSRTGTITRSRFTASVMRDGKEHVVLNKTSTRPCFDPIMGVPLRLFLKMKDDCIVQNKNYTLSNFAPPYWIKKVFKNQMYYERFILKMEIWGADRGPDVGFCIDVIADTLPEQKPKKIKSKTSQ